MRRALLVLPLLAACHHARPAQVANQSTTTAEPRPAGSCAGDERVSACVESPSRVVVTVHDVRGAVYVELDVTYPHASVACGNAWSQLVYTGDGDQATAVFDIPPTDECALHDEMQASVRLFDGADLTSKPFKIP